MPPTMAMGPQGSASHDDAALRHALLQRNVDTAGYWDFRGGAGRDAMHSLSTYPAMMVPNAQQDLMATLMALHGGAGHVLDPFVGSGTTLTEAMRLGLDFTGQDVNPLAVLMSRAKAGPFDVPALAEGVETVLHTAERDQARATVTFPGREKWFAAQVTRQLGRLRRAIRAQQNLWVRRVLWLALAEAVRLSCNSRTTTYKLHTRPAEELATRQVDAREVFATTARRAVAKIAAEVKTLSAAGVLRDGHYTGRVRIELGDTATSLCMDEASGQADVIITSPPYGDNATTVPYGQFSFLPLQWIDLRDIHERATTDHLASTHAIDSLALGGSRRDAANRAADALAQSQSLRGCVTALAHLPQDRAARVQAFAADLHAALGVIAAAVATGGHMAWTVGNRSVGGKPVPLDGILVELLGAVGFTKVVDLQRTIPSKRMAVRNATSQTMRREQILVFRKVAAS